MYSDTSLPLMVTYKMYAIENKENNTGDAICPPCVLSGWQLIVIENNAILYSFIYATLKRKMKSILQLKHVMYIVLDTKSVNNFSYDHSYHDLIIVYEI